jgi:hypothetical protein
MSIRYYYYYRPHFHAFHCDCWRLELNSIQKYIYKKTAQLLHLKKGLTILSLRRILQNTCFIKTCVLKYATQANNPPSLKTFLEEKFPLPVCPMFHLLCYYVNYWIWGGGVQPPIFTALRYKRCEVSLRPTIMTKCVRWAAGEVTQRNYTSFVVG